MEKDNRLVLLNILKEMIGKTIKVYIDRPIGYNHKGIIYTQNYGYIKEYVAADGEYQDAYVIGIYKPLTEYIGKIIAIINRKDDNEDKLVICDVNRDYNEEEIEKLVDFQEKYFHHEIIKNNDK